MCRCPEPRHFRQLAALLLLLLVPVFGTGRSGRHWLYLGAFYIQPAELMKLSVPLMTAAFLGERVLPPRWGALAVIVVTELATAFALVAIYLGPRWASIPLVALLGFMLNGTSSALSVSVAQFVPPAARARGFGAYFTAALVSSAVAPLAYGVLGDAASLSVVFVVMALMAVAGIPAVFPVRHALDPR